MTRRRNSQPHRPLSSSPRAAAKKQEENKDNELRQARAVKKAEAQEKLRLRRHEWDPEQEAELDDTEDVDLGEGWDDHFGEDGDETSEDEESEA
jgi:hypothetical protein